MTLQHIIEHGGAIEVQSPLEEQTQPSPERGPYRRVGKRALDVLGALLMIPIFLPLIALLALVVMWDGHGPFFRQERVGRYGRCFRMWKLRSMVPYAEDKLAAHLAAHPAARAEWERHQKLEHDPRVTLIGRIMRAFSLDELPQIWNVLRGEMSLVGPRPILPQQTALYPGQAYYRLRPGLTGPWQVSERHASTFAERARFDNYYAERLSLGTDLRLICVTFGVVVCGKGC